MNRLSLQFLFVLALVSVCASTGAESANSEKTFLLATAPSGAFRLVCKVEGASPLWLVPAKNPDNRVPLPTVHFPAPDPQNSSAGLHEVSSDAFDGLPLTFISPDERWIFVQMEVDETASYTVGWLYRRVESSAADDPRYELAAAERFDTLAWRFFCGEKKIPEKDLGVPDSFSHRVMSITFAAWSEDSGRLLFSLSGGIGARKEPMGEFPQNAGPWLCYFNTRTGAFEQTDRLRAANQAKEPSDILTAESIGQEGPETSWGECFEKADSVLNAGYASLMKSLAPDRKAKLQQEQRDWLKERDLFAAIHANQSWSPFPGASWNEGLTIATLKRAEELRELLFDEPYSEQRSAEKETTDAGVVRDESPDHHFGVQYIFAKSEAAETEGMPTEINLVALPSKKLVTKIDAYEDEDWVRNIYRGTGILWAPDSQRFVYTAKSKRGTGNYVFERQDGTFEKLTMPDLDGFKPKLKPNEQVRKENGNFNEPVRWLKPKALLIHRSYSVVVEPKAENENEVAILEGDYDLVISFDAKGKGKVEKVLKSQVSRSK